MKLKDQTTSIKQRLSNLAQKKNLSYQIVATNFLLERLLARLITDKKLFNSLVFKGGYVGLRIYNSNRYTIDLDALLVKSNIQSALEQTRLAAEKDLSDAVWFCFEKQIDLQTQGEYGGIRQVFRAGIGQVLTNIKRAQIIHFDLGIGDPVTPKPIKKSTPELIGKNDLSWFVYPIETMIAEKIHALVDRGENNSRSKDIFDLAYFLPKADGATLKKALHASFEYRKTTLPNNLIEFLREIDLSLLKSGWPSIASGIKNAPSCEEAYQSFIDELQKFF